MYEMALLSEIRSLCGNRNLALFCWKFNPSPNSSTLIR